MTNSRDGVATNGWLTFKYGIYKTIDYPDAVDIIPFSKIEIQALRQAAAWVGDKDEPFEAHYGQSEWDTFGASADELIECVNNATLRNPPRCPCGNPQRRDAPPAYDFPDAWASSLVLHSLLGQLFVYGTYKEAQAAIKELPNKDEVAVTARNYYDSVVIEGEWPKDELKDVRDSVAPAIPFEIFFLAAMSHYEHAVQAKIIYDLLDSGADSKYQVGAGLHKTLTQLGRR